MPDHDRQRGQQRFIEVHRGGYVQPQLAYTSQSSTTFRNKLGSIRVYAGYEDADLPFAVDGIDLKRRRAYRQMERQIRYHHSRGGNQTRLGRNDPESGWNQGYGDGWPERRPTMDHQERQAGSGQAHFRSGPAR